MQKALRRGAEAGDQVLHVLDEQPPAAPRVQIPGRGDEAVDDLVPELGEVPARRAQIGHDLGKGEAPGPAHHVGQGRSQQEFHHVLGVVAAEIGVENLGDRLPAASDVVGDRILQAVVDLVKFGEGLAVVEIEVVGVDLR